MRTLELLYRLVPGGARRWERRRERRRRRRLEGIGNRQERFTHIYATNKWKSSESVSGHGSTLAYTEGLRSELPKLFTELGVERLLDAPCGDHHWFSQVPRESGPHYIGGDIVEPLVDANRARYGSPQTEFVHLDIVKGPLPPADLWICRDCWIHLSDADAIEAIRRFIDSDIRYLLTTDYPNLAANVDIPTGSFRSINLCRPPFSFPEPLRSIDDWVEGFMERRLALWERESLADALRANPAFAGSAATGSRGGAGADRA